MVTHCYWMDTRRMRRQVVDQQGFGEDDTDDCGVAKLCRRGRGAVGIEKWTKFENVRRRLRRELSFAMRWGVIVWLVLLWCNFVQYNIVGR